MKHYGRIMLLTLGLGFFAVVLSSLPGNPAAAPAAPAIDVDVVNTPTVNAHVTNTSIPVTGSVNAAVTGTVNANITNGSVPVSGTVAVSSLPAVTLSGTPSVAVTSLPALSLSSVTVANTAANPVPTQDSDAPARHLWTTSCSISTPTVTASCTIPATAGEVVVITTETYQFDAQYPNPVLLVTLNYTAGTQPMTVQTVIPAANGVIGFSLLDVTTSDLVYLDPGTQLVCSAVTQNSNSVNPLVGQCYFSGYYVTF